MIGLIPPPGVKPGNYKYKPAPVNVQEPLPSANNPSNFHNIKKPPGGILPPSPVGGGGGRLLPILLPLLLAIPPVLLFDVPTSDNGDSMLKKLLQPANKPPNEIKTPSSPFTGGQSNGIGYRITATLEVTNYSTPNRQYPGGSFTEVSTLDFTTVWGPVESIYMSLLPNYSGQGFIDIALLIRCRGKFNEGNQYYPIKPLDTYVLGLRQKLAVYPFSARLVGITVSRLDGQPDTSGNPPPTLLIPTEPERIIANPERLKPSRPVLPVPKVPDFPFPKEPYVPETIEPKNPGQELPIPPIQPEVPIPPFEPITDLDIASPTNQELPPPVIIIGPSADPGTTTITKPKQIPDDATDFKPNEETKTPEPEKPKTPEKPKVEPTPEKDPFEKFREDVGKIIPLIPTIANNTDPNKIKDNVRDATCQTFNAGGCNADIRKNAQDAANNSASNNNRLDALNAGMQALDLSLLKVIDDKLGAKVPGGISGFLQRAFYATRLDKIINALTLITVLHNAAMLSRSLGSTLGDLTGQALSVIGIKDENGAALDIDGELGKQVNNFMSTILGAETWAGTKLAWNKANTILSSASQIVYTARSLFDSGREVTEWIANNTGKIGNALKRFRVVGENAYPHLSENVSHQNAWLLKVQKYREGVDTLDDAASSLQGVLGEVQNIQQESQELKEQKQRFDQAIKADLPKEIPDNNQIKEKAAVTKTDSASPSNQADVFRGEGETDNA